MKRFTIILSVFIALAITANSQISNNGFEDWTTVGSYENPDEWACMNYQSAGSFYSCTKSTDHFPETVGDYSIRLENNPSLDMITGGYGMAITNAFDWPFKPAFPILGHPNSLTGYYKFNSVSNDSMFIRIVLFELGVVVTSHLFATKVSAPNWTAFNIPLTYETADSATIHLSAFYPTSELDGPNGNSVLYVDNLNFDNLITYAPNQILENVTLKVYPNPASDIILLEIDNQNNSDLVVNIFDISGTLIKSEILLQSDRQINIGDLSNGIYLLEIKSKEWTERQKLIIQR